MRLSQIIFVVGFVAFAPLTYGALNISGTPSGASNYEAATTGSTTGGTTAASTLPTIYGGVAGSSATSGCGIPDNVNPCNNCTGVKTELACNTTRIYDNLMLSIPLAETGNVGVARLKLNAGAGTTTAIDIGNSLSAVNIRWGTICTNAVSGSSCDGIVDQNLSATIFIDTDGSATPTGSEPQLNITIAILGSAAVATGIDNCSVAKPANTFGVCSIVAYPGDQKIYIKEAEGSGAFPTNGSRKAKKLRVFLSSINYDQALPTLAEQEVDLSMNDDGVLSDRRVKGLENGRGYFLRVGVVDNANNVDAVTSDVNILSSESDCVLALTAAPDATMNCLYYAKPDEVLGMLSEDMNCFIATAAFGSQTEKYLELLREFRFQKLIPYKLGRSFVYQYYKYGPYAARFINDHTWLKPVVRLLLWPVISFSWLALHYGWTAAIAFLLMTIFALVLALRTFRKSLKGTLRAQ